MIGKEMIVIFRNVIRYGPVRGGMKFQHPVREKMAVRQNLWIHHKQLINSLMQSMPGNYINFINMSN